MKLAICISGHLRDSEKFINNLKNNLLGPLEDEDISFDIFLYTFSNKISLVDNCLEKGINDIDISIETNKSIEIYKSNLKIKKLKIGRQELEKIDKYIDYDYIGIKYKKIIDEDYWKNEIRHRMLNLYKHINNSLKLIDNLDEYSHILWRRPDFYYYTKFEVNLLKDHDLVFPNYHRFGGTQTQVSIIFGKKHLMKNIMNFYNIVKDDEVKLVEKYNELYNTRNFFPNILFCYYITIFLKYDIYYQSTFIETMTRNGHPLKLRDDQNPKILNRFIKETYHCILPGHDLSKCKKPRKKIAYCFYDNYNSIIEESNFQHKKMNKVFINLNYKHFRKYVLDVNKNIDIDIFLISYNIDSKDDIIELYKPVKSKFMKPKLDFDFFKHEKYNIYSKDDKDNYNIYISNYYSLFKLGQMLKKYSDNNKVQYDNVIISKFDLAFQKPLDLNIHINENIKLVNSFNSVYLENNNTPYTKENLSLVNNDLPNPNKNILLLGYQKVFNVNDILIMGSMNCIYNITLLYPLLCELNKEENFIANSNYENKEFSISPDNLFSYIILGLISINNLKINHFKDLYYDKPISKNNFNYLDKWMEKVSVVNIKSVYLKFNKEIGDVIIKSNSIREFFNIDDFKNTGLTDEELELIR